MNASYQDLRAKAENLLKTKYKDKDVLPIDDVQDLLHELAVYQIELEMQNESLLSHQQELESLNTQYKTLYNAAPVGYLNCNPAGEILKVNHTASTLLNQSTDKIMGTQLQDWVVTEDQDKIHVHQRTLIREKTTQSCELRVYTPQNELGCWVHIKSVLLPLPNKTETLHALFDISEQKLLEHQLIQTQRLRAIGELSAGLNHNLNNILMGITGPLYFLQQMPLKNDVLEEINNIATSATRASNLIRDMGSIFQETPPSSFQAVDLGRVIHQAANQTKFLWKDHAESLNRSITVHFDLDPTLYVKGIEQSLFDVFVNLFMNATEAISDSKGTISVSSQTVGTEGLISFSDTGSGMDAETQLRIFEPFFTTKMTIGTGLGLAMAYHTISQFGGHISVESSPNEGTRFKITLPLQTPTTSQPKAKTNHPFKENQARILIVEDDQMVRNALSHLLQKHTVHTLDTGLHLEQVLGKKELDVVLIDLGLPNLSGDQVCKKVKAFNSSITTIMISGWLVPKDDPRRAFADFFVQKPIVDIDNFFSLLDKAIQLKHSKNSI